MSDGDLDGLFSTGILLRYFDSLEISMPFRFPPPGELHGLSVKNAILIELGPTKGLYYKGWNILIDHHEEFSGIYIFNGSDMEKRIVEFNNMRSSIEIMVTFLGNNITLDSEMLEMIDIISQIDNGTYKHPMALKLHRSYMLNISSTEMRKQLTTWVRDNQVSAIWNWVEKESNKWDLVQKKSTVLMDSVSELLPNIGFFVVDVGNPLQLQAARDAMLQLENRFRVVVALMGTNDGEWMIQRGSIGSKDDHIDFGPLYELLRAKGLTAGGRSRIGGFQFTSAQSLTAVLTLLRNVLGRLCDEKQ